MSIENSKKLNRVLCTCLKCRNKGIEEGIGMLIPKFTRTRHRKKENKNLLNYSLDSSSSSELISNVKEDSIGLLSFSRFGAYEFIDACAIDSPFALCTINVYIYK